MPEMPGSCQVCRQHAHKYKCPKCRIKYCSLVCFKSHRDTSNYQCICHNGMVTESPCTPTEQGDKTYVGQVLQLPPEIEKTAKEEGELSESDSEETEDKVPLDRLKNLQGSQEIKSMLENPHLQQMLLRLDKTNTPHLEIQNAMQEPIFTELADACLRVVEPEKYQFESLSL